MVSSVKCVSMVAAAGALVAGSVNAYRGVKGRKIMLADAQRIADANGGKIPTGGMTKDGTLWDGFTTVDKIKKESKKGVAIGAGISAVAAGVMTAVVSGLTLLAKAHIK